MKYVKVHLCQMEGCKRPVWEAGEDYCDRCREEMDALDIEDEPKTLAWLFSILLMAFFVAAFVWGWLVIGGAR